MITHVDSIQNTDPWAKAGIMFRNSTSAGSLLSAFTKIPGISSHSNGAIRTTTQPMAGRPSEWNSRAELAQAVKSGSTFTAYYATTTAAPTHRLDFGRSPHHHLYGSSLLGGLAATAHNNGLLNTDIFSGLLRRNKGILRHAGHGLRRASIPPRDVFCDRRQDRSTTSRCGESVQTGSVAWSSPVSSAAWQRQPPKSISRCGHSRHGSGIHSVPRKRLKPADSFQIEASDCSPHVFELEAGNAGRVRAGEHVADRIDRQVAPAPALHARLGPRLVVIGQHVDDLHLARRAAAWPRRRWRRPPRPARAWAGAARG